MEAIQLHHGDCLGENGMKTLADKSIDMILCDLPFGITCCKWDKRLDLEAVFKEYMRVIKDNGAIVLFSCQPFTTDLIIAGRKYFRYSLVWDKITGSDFLLSKKKPMKAHEDILIFYKKLPTYNVQLTTGTPYKVKWRECEYIISANGENTINRPNGIDNKGTRFPTTVLRFKREGKNILKHPTQKPVSLLEWLIKTYTNEGELI
jgi:site-specific DNA-methyltransferase (adenine-specific)